MIKINNKQTNKIMINNKEVLKVVLDGNVKYQKQTSPSRGRYVLQGSINNQTFTGKVMDTTTETRLWDGNVQANIQGMGNGKYRINYSFIVQALQQIAQYFGGNIYNLVTTNLYLTPSLQVKMAGKQLRNLKAFNYNNNTVFETTAQGTKSGSTTSNVTIQWNNTNIISQYWDTQINGIEDISCQQIGLATVSNNYYTQVECYTLAGQTSTDLKGVLNIGVEVYFE